MEIPVSPPLGEEIFNPRQWTPTESRLHYLQDRMSSNDKPENRIAFEERVQMVFDGLIRSELNHHQRETVRISSRMIQKEFKFMTAEERENTASVTTRDISDTLIAGNTAEAIHQSLTMASGLRVAVRRLNEAVDRYFVPVTYALVGSQLKEAGENSPLRHLDINTLQMIAAACTVWVEGG